MARKGGTGNVFVAKRQPPPYVPDKSDPTLFGNAKRTLSRMKKRKRG